MAEIIRVSPKEVRQKVQSGEVLLVCAYQSEEKFNKYHLAGAISHGDFLKRANGISKNQEIVFCCNSVLSG